MGHRSLLSIVRVIMGLIYLYIAVNIFSKGDIMGYRFNDDKF